jgi:hypothetical protein
MEQVKATQRNLSEQLFLSPFGTREDSQKRHVKRARCLIRNLNRRIRNPSKQNSPILRHRPHTLVRPNFLISGVYCVSFNLDWWKGEGGDDLRKLKVGYHLPV